MGSDGLCVCVGFFASYFKLNTIEFLLSQHGTMNVKPLYIDPYASVFRRMPKLKY